MTDLLVVTALPMTDCHLITCGSLVKLANDELWFLSWTCDANWLLTRFAAIYIIQKRMQDRPRKHLKRTRKVLH